MNHTFNSKVLDIIFGGKENKVMLNVPCPISSKASVAVVNLGEPINSFFDNYYQITIYRVSMTPLSVLGPFPWSELTGPRIDMCSTLSQPASSSLESLGLDFRAASHEFLELGDANMQSLYLMWKEK